VATTKELSERLDALVAACHRLATHTAVLAVAVRDPTAVPRADLDAALAGLDAVHDELAELDR
jgi:hypothetical protein